MLAVKCVKKRLIFFVQQQFIKTPEHNGNVRKCLRDATVLLTALLPCTAGDILILSVTLLL